MLQTFKIIMSISTTDVYNAKITLLRAIDSKYHKAEFAELYMSDIARYDLEWFYSCDKAPNFKTVYFVKFKKGCEPSLYCPLVRKRSHQHKTSRASYTVNVFSGQVIQMCFSKVCKTRSGGKFMLATGEEESSSEEGDYDSAYDSSDEVDVDLAIDDPNDFSHSPTRKRQRESFEIQRIF